VQRPTVVALFLATIVALGGTAQAQETATPAAAAPPPQEQTGGRGLYAEPAPLRKAIELGVRRLGGDEPKDKTKSGFYPEMGNMVTGAGWISAGVGYRHWLFQDRAVLDASTGISWRAYKMAQVRFEVLPWGERFSFGTMLRWQDLTQVTYYGEGPDSLIDDRSEYRLKSLDNIGFVTVRPRDWLALHGTVGWLSAPRLGEPAGPFKRGNPTTFETFPDDPVFQLDEQPDFLHTQGAIVVDTRDEAGYPTRGGLYRTSIGRYSDREADRFSFGRYEAEAVHFVPLVSDNVVVALRGWVVGTSTAPEQHVPFYLAPSLGGNNTLRGFNDYRFHDRNLALVNTEVRVAIFEHLDVVGLFEAGNVAPRFAELNLDKTAYGVGLRVHTATDTFARFDVAHSEEGWHFVFRMNDPFRLSRFNKRTAQAPFAP
jgi:hypothetical protein